MMSSDIREASPIRRTYCQIKCVEWMRIPSHSGEDLRDEFENRKYEERQSFCRKEQISSVDELTRDLKRERDFATHFPGPWSMKAREVEKMTSSAVGIIR